MDFNVTHISDLYMSVKANKVFFFDRKSHPAYTLGLLGLLVNGHMSWQTSFDPDALHTAIRYFSRNNRDIFIVSGDLSTTGEIKNLEVAFNLIHSNITYDNVVTKTPPPSRLRDLNHPF